jgi:hypothetical protein
MASNSKNIAELLNTDTSIEVGDIADDAVTTAKIADDAVTSAKLDTNISVAGTLDVTGDINSSGNVTINSSGTIPTGVLLGKQLVVGSSTGSEIIAFREDTSVAVADKVGAFLIGNSDTDGAEDHFVGMWGKVSSTNGSQNLHFAAGRSGYEGDTPQMSLMSSGNVGIGTDAPSARLYVNCDANTVEPVRINDTNASGTNYKHRISFRYQDTEVGVVYSNDTGTQYSTTSDIRLKENINPISDATDKLMNMKPVTHTWINNPESTPISGFIAQEMREILPEAVGGDESEGMLGVDYGRITPTIVAALQDAIKEIDELKNRIIEMEKI